MLLPFSHTGFKTNTFHLNANFEWILFPSHRLSLAYFYLPIADVYETLAFSLRSAMFSPDSITTTAVFFTMIPMSTYYFSALYLMLDTHWCHTHFLHCRLYISGRASTSILYTVRMWFCCFYFVKHRKLNLVCRRIHSRSKLVSVHAGLLKQTVCVLLCNIKDVLRVQDFLNIKAITDWTIINNLSKLPASLPYWSQYWFSLPLAGIMSGFCSQCSDHLTILR